MADWNLPGLSEATARRLEEAGFSPESVARAKPSELVKRAGLRADLARRIVTHYRGMEERVAVPEASPTPDGNGQESDGDREWVWDAGTRPQRAGAWKWTGKVALRVSMRRGE